MISRYYLKIPPRIPHRNRELSLLSQLFLPLLMDPYSLSRKILILGGTRTGKSATVKLFGEMLEKAAQKRSVNIKYVHVKLTIKS